MGCGASTSNHRTTPETLINSTRSKLEERLPKDLELDTSPKSSRSEEKNQENFDSKRLFIRTINTPRLQEHSLHSIKEEESENFSTSEQNWSQFQQEDRSNIGSMGVLPALGLEPGIDLQRPSKPVIRNNWIKSSKSEIEKLVSTKSIKLSKIERNTAVGPNSTTRSKRSIMNKPISLFKVKSKLISHQTQATENTLASQANCSTNRRRKTPSAQLKNELKGMKKSLTLQNLNENFRLRSLSPNIGFISKTRGLSEEESNEFSSPLNFPSRFLSPPMSRISGLDTNLLSHRTPEIQRVKRGKNIAPSLTNFFKKFQNGTHSDRKPDLHEKLSLAESFRQQRQRFKMKRGKKISRSNFIRRRKRRKKMKYTDDFIKNNLQVRSGRKPIIQGSLFLTPSKKCQFFNIVTRRRRKSEVGKLVERKKWGHRRQKTYVKVEDLVKREGSLRSRKRLLSMNPELGRIVVSKKRKRKPSWALKSYA
jgi:hypothetical protein